MNKKNKILTGIIMIILIIWGVSTLVANNDPENKPTVKIGVTLPLTGDVAMLGQNSKQALLLAQEQISKNTKYNYEFVFEDDQFKTQMGASTANKLIGINNVSALFSFGSPVGNVVSPIAEKAGVTHINFFASDMNVANGEYNFVNYTPPYKDSELFVKELNRRGIKSVVIFGQQDNPGAVALISAFENDIKNTDIKVLSTQKFNTGTRDFRTQIATVKALNPNIYVLEVTSPELETLTKQLREAGIKTPVTTMEAFEFSSDLSLFEGMWYVNAADPQKWFVDLFTKRYPNDAPKFGAANGYDSVNLIVQAVEKAGDGKTVPSREEIKNALSEIKGFNGALGDNLSIDKDGVVVSEAVVREVRDGKSVTVGQ
jgi:branched-chain amino acid transport system substrate-binding protein